mgnify:CR=1 FL=1
MPGALRGVSRGAEASANKGDIGGMEITKILTARSLARRYGVDPKWLIAEAHAGRLPGVRSGRTFLFDPEAVERTLHERAQRPAALVCDSKETPHAE